MKAFHFKRGIVELRPYEEISSRRGSTRYLFRGVDEHGLVLVELKDRQRTKLTCHPSNLYDVMIRAD
ncbi:hypothetical protein LGH82_23575 [Mesorhizobium sp. PAMC28654]|uniref:hypothetical protein n=1 Tax=Mesorhizobium sp. PAMC28654 TaxID=2880934 RepID=UPI001D0BE1C8|nr:hypothetical protein [Mesorhizobium sp. PAMC28654]UDL88117.1 hypothetical protein LGH82_23575 [Mesorhizobium sp. PAMC28654]